MRRLIACAFEGYTEAGRYTRMADVLEHTARTQLPTWEIRVDRQAPEHMRSALGIRSHIVNTQKMEHWYRAVTAAADGDELLLIDSDTVILRPLDDIWGEAFDVAYTVRHDFTFPFNSGVVFARVSWAVRAFFLAWRNLNRMMLDDRDCAWLQQYGGINQAALAGVLASDIGRSTQVLPLSCVEWNCEDSAWKHFDPAVTRILHVKSALRRAVFGVSAPGAGLQELARLWHALERAAQTVPAGGR